MSRGMFEGFLFVLIGLLTKILKLQHEDEEEYKWRFLFIDILGISAYPYDSGFYNYQLFVRKHRVAWFCYYPNWVPWTPDMLRYRFCHWMRLNGNHYVCEDTERKALVYRVWRVVYGIQPIPYWWVHDYRIEIHLRNPWRNAVKQSAVTFDDAPF